MIAKLVVVRYMFYYPFLIVCTAFFSIYFFRIVEVLIAYSTNQSILQHFKKKLILKRGSRALEHITTSNFVVIGISNN